MEDKRELRTAMRLKKSQCSLDDKKNQSAIILNKLEQLPEFQKAQHVLMYYSLLDEVSTIAFIDRWYTRKKIYLPVINGDTLDIVLYEGKDCLVPGDKYEIPEPQGQVLSDESVIELVVVPGMAFDFNNNRLGRGAGYYDRVLSRMKGVTTVGLAYDFQMVEKVPVELHDVPMSMVIHP